MSVFMSFIVILNFKTRSADYKPDYTVDSSVGANPVSTLELPCITLKSLSVAGSNTVYTVGFVVVTI
jgi:hypothetical protein